MEFDRPADYFVLFELPDPEQALAVGFWNYGEAVTEPFHFSTKLMERIAEIIAPSGYQMFQSDRPDEFMSFILVRNDVDVHRALKAGQEFLKTLSVEVLKDALQSSGFHKWVNESR